MPFSNPWSELRLRISARRNTVPKVDLSDPNRFEEEVDPLIAQVGIAPALNLGIAPALNLGQNQHDVELGPAEDDDDSNQYFDAPSETTTQSKGPQTALTFRNDLGRLSKGQKAARFARRLLGEPVRAVKALWGDAEGDFGGHYKTLLSTFAFLYAIGLLHFILNTVDSVWTGFTGSVMDFWKSINGTSDRTSFKEGNL